MSKSDNVIRGAASGVPRPQMHSHFHEVSPIAPQYKSAAQVRHETYLWMQRYKKDSAKYRGKRILPVVSTPSGWAQ
jgi:hypothetical protein